ncbi:hypothetical protein [Gymnodinialimonas ceratoperidinii]|uniref:Uncharacterized protein n=1 Tax=Gymnodinialimonas ceratoperidinii TaxID=2856823 RepID=A0A8F6TYJ3_9RHOB|nr:hypothetical protein [Gymnodinialimonas ceratoperidinii]QXT40293.1 hypothetical protein KYE46_03310 [Gymnodinialimonas ceratoperidinii]
MSPRSGARNLLKNCARAQAGQSLLIAHEPADLGYFDGKVVGHVAREARDLGLHVRLIDVGFDAENPQLSPALLEQVEHADIVLFLARLGDQLRFCHMPEGKTIVTSFAATEELLGSGFGTGHYHAFEALKAATDRALGHAREVRLTCPRGTDVRGATQLDGADTRLKRFPLSVFAALPAARFSGRVALPGFLTGTGSKYYTPYHLSLDGPLLALFSKGRLTGFAGAPHAVAQAEAHYDHVAGKFDLDRNTVHSWHAGIHPGCGFPWTLEEHTERWGGTAFGNPRLAHFHTCGAYAPGEISWNVIDPTISLDGVPIWEDGVFQAHRLSGVAEIFSQYPDVAAMFASPDRAIGLSDRALYAEAAEV